MESKVGRSGTCLRCRGEGRGEGLYTRWPRPYKPPVCTAFQHTQMAMMRMATEPSGQSMIGVK